MEEFREGTCNAYIDHYKYCGVSYGGIYGTFRIRFICWTGEPHTPLIVEKGGSLSSVYQYVFFILGLNT